VVLLWRKRLWRCREPAGRVRTRTERTAAVCPRAVLTERARAEPAGGSARTPTRSPRWPVTWGSAGRPSCGPSTSTALRWWTTPTPGRCRRARPGRDQPLKATRRAPTRYVTGLVDLEQGRLLEVVADRTRAAVGRWLGGRPRGWLAQVGTVALDPWRGYASALAVPLVMRPWS
jgi:transposase